MNTKVITEDYVSFEIAQLLKEKGFDEACKAVYEKGILRINTLCDYYNSELSSYVCAPTHQMTLKWLREVHNIVIEINMDDYMTTTDSKLKVTYSYTIWTFIQHLGKTGFTDAKYDDRAFWQENVKVGQSFEEACEAAIKYCLENLLS